ncbi:hypothetical protein PFISCL1PPCAC_11675, partial [Pristionchus fissidentatus]
GENGVEGDQRNGNPDTEQKRRNTQPRVVISNLQFFSTPVISLPVAAIRIRGIVSIIPSRNGLSDSRPWIREEVHEEVAGESEGEQISGLRTFGQWCEHESCDCEKRN